MKKFALDKIEGQFYIFEDLETKEIIEVNIKTIPLKLKEGDIVKKKDNGTYTLDLDETRLRKEHIKKMLNELFKH